VSTRRPRYRYIAFRVEGPRAFSPDEVLEALRGLPARPHLVGFNGRLGLARCIHVRKDETIAALRSIERVAGESVRTVTLGTSGTIRRATSKYLDDRATQSARASRKEPL